MDNTIDIINYNSIKDFMMEEPTIPHNEEVFRGSVEKMWFSMRHWYGANSLNEVKQICSSGWDDGLKIYKDMKQQVPEIEGLGSFHRKYARKKRHADCGGEIDIDRYIHNEYETMFIDYERYIQNKSGKIITLYTSIGIVCSVLSSDSLWNGVATTILTDIFESFGYRVNIIAFRAGRGTRLGSDYHKSQINIQVKLPDQPLDLTSVLISTSFPGFYRYYGFKALSSRPYKISHGYGQSLDFPYSYENNSFIIGGVRNSESAYLKILEVLNSFKTKEGVSCV